VSGKFAVLVVALVIAATAVGSGYAYTSTLISEGGDLNVDHVSAVNSKGGSYIQVPATPYTQPGSTWVPADESLTTTGTLTLTASGNATVGVRAWVEFKNPLTWTTVKAVTFNVRGTDYTCFTAPTESGPLKTCVPTEVMTLAPGDHPFSINVVYKTGLDVNPTAYTGDNMRSRVVFLMADTDPMTVNMG